MDLTHYLNFESLRKRKEKINRIFFYRICGTGMGASAVLLKQKGYEVEGGDHKFGPPMSTYLEQSGIPLYQLSKVDDQFLKSFDLIVVGNVVPGKSDEARRIEKLGVGFCSFPVALGAFVLADVNVIGIAGTHGKTTTTYLATQVFENLGEKPGCLVGGVIEGKDPAYLGDGRYFFIESDEYESCYFEKYSKFRSYCLDHMILTSLEFDHADFFKDLSAIKEQFQSVFPQMSGRIILNDQYLACRELYHENQDRTKGSWFFYGRDGEYGPNHIQTSEHGSTFELKLGQNIESFQTNLVGAHNIENLCSVIIFAHLEGYDVEKIKQSILNLSMVKRRQEIRGLYHGAIVVDDFAHHPRAVKETIETIKMSFPHKQVVAVFGAHSATARSALFQEEFAQALAYAPMSVIVKSNQSTSVKGIKDLSYEQLTRDLIQDYGRQSIMVDRIDDLISVLKNLSGPDKVLLIMSNSSCLGLWESAEFVHEISQWD